MEGPLRKTTYLFYMLIVFILFYAGCTADITPTILGVVTVGPNSGTILIEGGAETTYIKR